MAARSAEATWQGTLKEGSGHLKLSSGAYEGAYTFLSRFEEGAGTNPEELISAAEAGCFTMALGNRLSNQGFTVNRLHTKADLTLEKVNEQMTITRIHLTTEGDIAGIDQAKFEEEANAAKTGCIISRALGSVEITLDAKLVG